MSHKEGFETASVSHRQPTKIPESPVDALFAIYHVLGGKSMRQLFTRHNKGCSASNQLTVNLQCKNASLQPVNSNSLSQYKPGAVYFDGHGTFSLFGYYHISLMHITF